MSTNRSGYLKAYYQTHKEQYREYARKAYEKKKALRGIEEIQSIIVEPSYSQRYYAANREAIKAKQKLYRENKKKKDAQRAYYETHKEQYRAYAKKAYDKKKRKERLSKTFLGRLRLKIKPE